MEALLGAADFDADEAERYGWINRALPDAELDDFVASDAVKARTATLFGHGLQTRGDLELDLGSRIGSL